MPVNSGNKLPKDHLDIDKPEQIRRFSDRENHPLKQRKTSPIAALAAKHGKAHSEARDAMLMRTHSPIAVWHIV